MASSASTLVIGSSSGIGFSIAQRLRTRGDSIVELASTLDLTNAEAVGESLRSLVGSGTVDYVVLAAIDPSAFRSAPIVSLTESEWDQAAEYSMRSAFVALQQAHGVLADGGRVILILPTVAATGVAGLVP